MSIGTKTNSELKISVIIPVYKVEDYLKQCVESVLNQTYTNLEVILIDDGSPDSCPDICDRYREKDSRVIVIHQKNGGISSARNAGLDIATGDIISFVDSDDWIDLDMFEQMIKQKIKTGAAIVCCDWVITDGIEEHERTTLNTKYGAMTSGERVSREILMGRIGNYLWNSLYDKNCWEDIRFPVGRVFEDIAVTFLVFEKVKTVAFLDASLYKYRINNNGITRVPNPLKYYDFFLSHKEQYEHTCKFYPDIAKECCSHTVGSAIILYFHACTDCKRELSQYIPEIREFIDFHKNTISYKCMPKVQKFTLKVYYLSNTLFRVLCFILYKSRLQKLIRYIYRLFF